MEGRNCWTKKVQGKYGQYMAMKEHGDSGRTGGRTSLGVVVCLRGRGRNCTGDQGNAAGSKHSGEECTEDRYRGLPHAGGARHISFLTGLHSPDGILGGGTEDFT